MRDEKLVWRHKDAVLGLKMLILGQKSSFWEEKLDFDIKNTHFGAENHVNGGEILL